MLKWLVTKSPTPPVFENSVTDDPLATLSRRPVRNEPIYAVSRVNPLFEEEAEAVTNKQKLFVKLAENEPKFPESPPTDRESVRSSGYGSKENDSVSYKSDGQEDEDHLASNEMQHNTCYRLTEDLNKEQNYIEIKNPRTVADIRKSFEVLTNPEMSLMRVDNNSSFKVITANPKFVKDIEIGHSISSSLQAIPEDSNESENGSISHKKSSWPRVSHLAQALQRQAERIHERRERERLKKRINKKVTNNNNNNNNNNNKCQVLRFNPLVSVVSQDRKYVTAISLSSPKRSQTQLFNKHNIHNSCKREAPSDSNFHLGVPSSGMSSYLKTNKYMVNTDQTLTLQPDSLITEDILNMMNSAEYDVNNRTEDMTVTENYYQAELPNFGRAIYSNFYPSIKSGKSLSHYSIDRKGENSKSAGRAKMNGVNVVKDLWEKSGLKTNGRKLLVNVNSLVADETFGREQSFRKFSKELHQAPNGLARANSNDNENLYEVIPHPTQVSSSYNYNEDISGHKKGIDNLGYINDKGNSMDSIASSLHSRHSYQFQHNLTEFQKRVSDRLHGEVYDTNSGCSVGNFTNETKMIQNDSQRTNQSTKKSKSHPGKAVRELGLEDNRKASVRGVYNTNYYNSPNTYTNNEEGHNRVSLGEQNRIQIWDQFYGREKDGTFPGYFYRHPNSEAPIFAQNGEGKLFHDFTLDAKRSQRIMQRSSRSKRRRKCCRGFIVLFAFIVFVGAIIGLSWFSTGGEKLFGSM